MDHVVRIDNGLIPKSEFIGLENIVHLAAGGEAPMLKSHIEVVNRFMSDKALAENSRVRMDDTVNRCKNKVATLFNVAAEDIALLSSSSEGINNLVYGLKWKPGDNVVACDVEFPSEILPWTRLKEKGVEIRIVRNRDWYVSLKDIERKIDKLTKIVAISHVSYFTGQRLPLAELSQMVRSCGALLCVDSTHSAGVIPVEAKLADIMVASCYKWLLATHGVAIFYLNRD
ncbi:MAG: aminotransferase class V-fold PLP-dependent enzyme, partial [Deltaproteobacteria bacterium]|nr:aminotransferase class V-fold PLP-dependent enzyme [Deltaproteobacteria bacterium]